MIKRIIYLLVWFVTISFVCLSCHSRRNKEQGKPKTNQEETLLRINKYLVGKDADIIKAYLKRRNRNMTVSETGLWHEIYQKGNGSVAQTGRNATIKYRLWLLDGTLCYSSDSLGVKKFRIGKGGIEKGLEEGILLMHVGDKARFIMPPHLAHGLVGDQDRIPPRSIILYEVELVQISD